MLLSDALFKRLGRAWWFIIGFICCTQVHSQPVYKYTDKSGNVVYSSTPPDFDTDVRTLDIATPPSTAALEAGKQRAEKIKESAKALEQSRLERTKARKEKKEQQAEKAPDPPSYLVNRRDNRAYPYPFLWVRPPVHPRRRVHPLPPVATPLPRSIGPSPPNPTPLRHKKRPSIPVTTPLPRQYR